jgi:hypothetical protein
MDIILTIPHNWKTKFWEMQKTERDHFLAVEF